MYWGDRLLCHAPRYGRIARGGTARAFPFVNMNGRSSALSVRNEPAFEEPQTVPDDDDIPF